MCKIILIQIHICIHVCYCSDVQCCTCFVEHCLRWHHTGSVAHHLTNFHCPLRSFGLLESIERRRTVQQENLQSVALTAAVKVCTPISTVLHYHALSCTKLKTALVSQSSSFLIKILHPMLCSH